jgi:RNA polymerase sigma-70 factor (ECF subfamily)
LLIDQESIVLFLLRERIKLLAYIASIVRDDHLAEDVFQEVAVLALRKREEIHDPTHFLAWMRLVARNRALKCLRERGRCLFLDERLLAELEDQWADFDLTPAADLTDALRHCLAKLSPYAQQLIRLRYVEGISGARLAEALDRQLNAVYVALSRIHRSLGACIRQRIS